MAPTIVLIRHAQGSHNVANNLHDAPLTNLGIQQCVELRRSLVERFSSVQSVAIISSPMRRTLQTALYSIDWLIDRGVKIEADADWQENSAQPCDTGSPLPSLTEQFPNDVDFSALDPTWPDKTSPAATGKYGYTRSSILERGRRCLEKLRERPEELIFVFTHSGFLRLGVVGYWFFNSDYRVFGFLSDHDGVGDDEAYGELVGEERQRPALRQREDTAAGGLGLSWTGRVLLGSELS